MSTIKLSNIPTLVVLARFLPSCQRQANCILVHYHEDGREWVPTATTRLDEHMRITAVIAPEAANALALLRRGCEAAAQ